MPCFMSCVRYTVGRGYISVVIDVDSTPMYDDGRQIRVDADSWVVDHEGRRFSAEFYLLIYCVSVRVSISCSMYY